MKKIYEFLIEGSLELSEFKKFSAVRKSPNKTSIFSSVYQKDKIEALLLKKNCVFQSLN